MLKRRLRRQKKSGLKALCLWMLDGKAAGLFGFDQDGQANLILLDKTGKVLWSAGGNPNAKPLAISLAK
jgi:hypothetical protein